MTQTEHYQLNQWSASDRVHHDDFNKDNLKIDAALAGKAEKWELFDTYSFSPQYPIMMTIPQDFDVDWSEWEYVMILCDYTSQDPGSNDTFKGTLSPGSESIFEIKAGPAIIYFAPHHDPSRTVSGLVVGSELAFFSAKKKYQDIEDITVKQIGSHNQYQLLGGTFRYYGMK